MRTRTRKRWLLPAHPLMALSIYTLCGGCASEPGPVPPGDSVPPVSTQDGVATPDAGEPVGPAVDAAAETSTGPGPVVAPNTPDVGVDSGSSAAGDAGASAPSLDSGAMEEEVVDVACDPADQGPEATPISGIGSGAEPAGEFATVVENDPGISDQTIFRPEPLGMIKHPVFAWGNGGCQKRNSGFSEFLLQLAAEGILVIADGAPDASGSSSDDGSQLIKAIDWAEKENERPCSKYYHKLDLTRVGVSGQSCGGLMALNASTDPRVSVSMPMNSGLFSRDASLYAGLHAPMAIVNGGSSDIAYSNGLADFEAIETIPIMLANLDVGHGGTYREDNGGEMGKLAIGWLRWHLLDDLGATGKGMFIGDSCGFCNSEWDIMWKMKPN